MTGGRILIYLTLLGLLVGCTGRPGVPSGSVLKKEKMIDVLTDIHLMDALLHEENSVRQDKLDKGLYLYPSILEKHQVTRTEVDSSLFYYNQYPKEFIAMYEEIIARMAVRIDSLKALQATDNPFREEE